MTLIEKPLPKTKHLREHPPQVTLERPVEIVVPRANEPEAATPAARRFTRKRVVTAVLGAVLLVGGSLYALHYYQWAQGHETTDDAFIDGHIVQVSPQVSGHVTKVYVEDNQVVRAGDPLVDLDPRDYQAAVDQAQARLAAAQADSQVSQGQVAQAQAQVTTAEAQVAQAQAKLASDEAEAERAQGDLARYDQARKQGVVTAQEWQEYQTRMRTTQAAVEASRKAVAAARAQVVQAQATAQAAISRIAASQAAIQQAQAGLESARLNLSYTHVVAAQDGRVTRKSVEAGNYVQPGQAILALVDPQVWVTANFKETQLDGIHPGQKVEVKVDAYPKAVFEGRVDSVQAGTGARFSMLPPENATGNYVKVVQRVPVKIVLDKPIDGQHLLAPGMSVEPIVAIR